MATRKIKQFRLYNAPVRRSTGEYDYTYCTNNSPSETSTSKNILEMFESGEVFESVYPISELGIQAPPGTKFYLNGSVYPIVMGASGIYDLDIKNGARVTGLSFHRESLQDIVTSGSSYLIVDVLYGEEDLD